MYAAIQPVNCGIIPVMSAPATGQLNIREALKAYYHQEATLAIPAENLRLIREDIAEYQRQLAQDFPSYGVARASDGGRGNAVSDPTPLMAGQYARIRREIEKLLAGLLDQELEVQTDVKAIQRQIRLVEIAVSHLDADSRHLLEYRYRDDRTLQYIALELFNANDASTAVYHLERVEKAISLLLNRCIGQFRRNSVQKVYKSRAKHDGANMVLSL